MPRPPSGDRPPLSLRTSPELRAKLAAAAAKSGRSISQEAEWFLERGATLAQQTQGVASKSLLSVTEYFIAQVEAEYGENWHFDEEARKKCRENLISGIDLMIPINRNVSRATKLALKRRRIESGDHSRERVEEFLDQRGIEVPSHDEDI